MSAAQFAGFMDKKGHEFPWAWQRRWFIFDQWTRVLTYSRTAHSKPLGRCTVRAARAVPGLAFTSAAARVDVNAHAVGKGEFTLHLSIPDDSSAHGADAWLDLFWRATTTAKPAAEAVVDDAMCAADIVARQQSASGAALLVGALAEDGYFSLALFGADGTALRVSVPREARVLQVKYALAEQGFPLETVTLFVAGREEALADETRVARIGSPQAAGSGSGGGGGGGGGGLELFMLLTESRSSGDRGWSRPSAHLSPGNQGVSFKEAGMVARRGRTADQIEGRAGKGVVDGGGGGGLGGGGAAEEGGEGELVTSALLVTEGRHYFEVGIACAEPGCDVMIGACTQAGTRRDHQQERRYVISGKSGGLFGGGMVDACRPRSRSAGAGAVAATIEGADVGARVERGCFQQGDRIGVLIDLDAGWLRFYRNGERFGPGFAAGVTGPLVCCAELLSHGQEVRLITDSPPPCVYLGGY